MMSRNAQLGKGSVELPSAVPKDALATKTVALIHPAWPFCGSHRVFVSQVEAYKALGAEVIAIAFADSPSASRQSTAQRSYFAKTQDIKADCRYYTGVPVGAYFRPSFFPALRQWLHGNFAAMLLGTAHQAQLPRFASGSQPKIDLIHCNHFFCMPLARSLRRARDCPIVLDTHDLQAKQFARRAQSAWHMPPRPTYDDMLSIELQELRTADALIHLNDDEAQVFQALLPDKLHTLIYPTVTPMPPNEGGGRDFIIVASANYPNFLSTQWFLQEILPLAGDVKVRIIGSVCEEFRNRAPRLYKSHTGLFEGITDNLERIYQDAAAILLPTIIGEGISIKTIEALSSGVPLIATRHAFRGMRIDATKLSNVTLADDSARFAEALRSAHARRDTPRSRVCPSDTQRLYEQMFSPDVYRDKLGGFVVSLLAGQRG